MIPQANAQLTRIAGGGLSEDDGGGYTAGADTTKWDGIVEAYVHEEVLAEADQEGLNTAKLTYIIIPGDLSPATTVVPEDTATFIYAGTTQTRQVSEVAAHVLSGHPRTVRLFLRPT